MKCIRVTPIVFLLYASVFSFAAMLNAQGKDKIAVVPLAGIHRDHGTRLAVENHLVDLLVAMKRFEIIERSQLEKIMAEQRLSVSGLTDDDEAIKLGKLIGADYLIIGSVTEASIVTTKGENDTYYKGKVTANIRVVSTETASILGSITETDQSHGALIAGDTQRGEHLYAKAAENLVNDTIKPKLYNLFPLTGYVIQILKQKDDEVEALIDLGNSDGIKKKDKFIIFRKGKVIIHPVTGEKLPGRIEELGEAEVKSVDPATSVVKIKTKSSIQIGDRIKSKKKKKSFWKKIG